MSALERSAPAANSSKHNTNRTDTICSERLTRRFTWTHRGTGTSYEACAD
jgi:hypothetical protein